MQGLFDPARHEPLTTTPWSESAAREAIQRIAAAAHAEFDATRGSWPAHPRDDPPAPDTRYAELYFGSGGAIWALRDLASQGAIDPDSQRDYRPWLAAMPVAVQQTIKAAGYTHGDASFLIGLSGVRLLQWSFTRERAVADELFAVVQGNLRNPAREALWGNPGTVLAAIHMAEATGEVRWMRLVQESVAVLLEEMQRDPETGTWVWEQDLYGRKSRMLGAGHGFAGNVYPALRAADLLDAGTVAVIVDRAWHTLTATALRSGEYINWHPMIDAERIEAATKAGRLPLVQDCHGSPGIVCRLATVPRSPEWDALLRGAGELTWAAGPLSKGAGLCHGTTNSTLTMLKLWRRFRDPLWLDRARSLAMHSIEQIERHRAEYGQGRHTVWTGDLGAACVLWNCVIADDRFPMLDHF